MHVTPKTATDCPWYLRPFFWNQRRKYGAVLESALLWARSPRLFLGVAILYGMIERKRSPLDPALRSLIIVRVSQINGCHFCVDLNSATLLERGVPMDKVLVNIDRYGNTSAATIPIGLCEALETGRLKSGDILLSCAFGAGLTAAAMLIRWGDRTTPIESSDAELPPCTQTGRELVQQAVEHFCR